MIVSVSIESDTISKSPRWNRAWIGKPSEPKAGDGTIAMAALPDATLLMPALAGEQVVKRDKLTEMDPFLATRGCR